MITIEKSIQAINSDIAFIVRYDDNNDFEVEFLDGAEPISKADILAKQSELQSAEDAKVQANADLKASAKAKLIAGEALTEEEADTIVL
jgi:hypothetical protein